MDPRPDLRQRLIAQRVIPVLRLASAELTERAIEYLAAAGFKIFEVTMTTSEATRVIRRFANRFPVGAGTVLDLDTAQRCIDAGAQFLVSPCLVPGMAKLARDAGRLALIGGFTPGEILAAHREGADIVKVFPASTGGPEHLRAIHAVFPDIPLCPTGGVSLENMRKYFEAGAVVVGVGNNIVDQKALAAGERARVVAHAQRFLE
ncbi:MAG TPA: bifunctional 4-hydroxy-2-oxoglutarate aldolase/2-dehydro-3-deoxy-phosphogluconate aldolase [Burkholderiales bacterium]|nr:bifunctional 4-hydroxy-2-oxoglutarate aldolase/2-dehydro-3-deoxy-phosphogluconate aldolase [Burkholderiales bacterium]